MQTLPNAIQFLQFSTILHVCVWPVIITKRTCWRHYPLLNVIFWLFKRCSSFVFSNILEDQTASIFRASELFKVDDKVTVLTKVLHRNPIHEESKSIYVNHHNHHKNLCICFTFFKPSYLQCNEASVKFLPTLKLLRRFCFYVLSHKNLVQDGKKADWHTQTKDSKT